MNERFFRCLAAVFTAFALCWPGWRQAHAAPALAGAPVPVQIGAYILKIHNVSQKDGTFDVDMWVWLRWKGDSLQPQKTFEIPSQTMFTGALIANCASHLTIPDRWTMPFMVIR